VREEQQLLHRKNNLLEDSYKKRRKSKWRYPRESIGIMNGDVGDDDDDYVGVDGVILT